MINDSTPGIDRRSRSSRQELLNEYILPERPVILTDAVEEWEAIGKWTPEFFKKNYPNVSLEVSGTRYTMPEQIDRIMNSSPAVPAPYPYSLEVGDHFPELLGDLEPQLVFGKIDRVTHILMPRALMHGTPFQEVFFGGHGSASLCSL